MKLREPPSQKIISFVCFAIIYLVWGSTYLGIKYAIENWDPLGMTSYRFYLGSLILGFISFAKRERRLEKRQLQIAALSGVFLVIANGLVCLAEKWIASGIAAVLVAAMPIWIVMINWLGFRGARPTRATLIGSCIGLCGVALVAVSQGGENQFAGQWAGVGFVVLSGWIWATGTLIQRRVGKISSVFLFTSVQLLVGALAVTALAFAVGGADALRISPQHISERALWAFLYLALFGSVATFTAYSWLVRAHPPELVSTYALVNPIVAVWLGWLLESEVITREIIMGTGLVLLGLYIVIMLQKRRPKGAS